MIDTAKNVVNLGDFGQLKKTIDSDGPAGRTLRECKELAAKRLRASIERMMEKVDDALFARAEKAENNQSQTMYFDAMRELRIIRNDIEEAFLIDYRARFDRGMPRSTTLDNGIKLNWEADDGGTLDLVDAETLEEDLAVTNMISKVRGTCTQSLYALDKRIGLLIRDPDLERWFNPLGPEAICNAFKTAAQKIETGIEIRLVIFKLFDQHVVTQLDALYKELNQFLVGRGILPEIKATIRKSPAGMIPTAGGTCPTPGPGQASRMADYSGAMSTSTLQGGVGIMVNPGYSTGGGGGPQGSGAGDGYGCTAGGHGAMTYAPVHALTILQQGNLPVASSDGDFNVDAIDLNQVGSGTVNILHGIKQSGLVGDLGRAGDMTLDIVAMLFDYILGDPNIPDPMRALIGRLQIPVLKVALLDRNFFAKKSHPARQLLNRLAQAAIGWNETAGTNDPLFKKVEAIVQTIIEEFEDDVSIFAALLADFDRFVQRDQIDAEIRAEQSAKVMEGQERLEVAKETTLRELKPRLSDRQGVQFIKDFINTHWKNLLFVTCAKYGKDSAQWAAAVATMDDLIWSVKPKSTVEDRKRLMGIQQDLINRLRDGMTRMSLPVNERDEFINRLIRAQGRTAVNSEEETSPEAQPEIRTDEQATVATTGGAEHTDAVEQPLAHAALPHIDDKFSDIIRGLKLGTWFEFNSSSGAIKRAKYSWVSPITGACLFTDRQGLKAASLTQDELANLLRTTRARIINDLPLLDRAVRQVLKDYRKA